MEKKGSLTTESISSRFENRFDLVSYAIKVAENMVRTGRAPRVRVGTENVATQVLAEIKAGKEVFTSLEEVNSAEKEAPSTYSTARFESKKEEEKEEEIVEEEELEKELEEEEAEEEEELELEEETVE